MEPEVEANPWKNKSRVKIIAAADVVVAIVGITYSTYQMFSYYFYIEEKKVPEFLKGPGHLPFYLFIWTVVLLLYAWQIAIAVILYAAVNQEAIETDPYVSIQKCLCWIRTGRIILVVVVLKLCSIIPLLVLFAHVPYGTTMAVEIIELIFRSAAIWGVRMFIQDLQ